MIYFLKKTQDGWEVNNNEEGCVAFSPDLFYADKWKKHFNMEIQSNERSQD